MFNELFQNESSSQTFFDTLSDAIIVIDESGVVHAFNHAASELFGYEAEAVVGNNVTMLMPESEQSRHGAYLKNRHKDTTGHVVGRSRPIQAVKRDGSSFPAHISISQFETQTGPLFLGFVRDLSLILAQHRLMESENEQLRIQHDIELIIHKAESAESLLRATLKTLVGMKALRLESKAGIFLVDGKSTAGSREVNEPDIQLNDTRGLRLAMVEGEFSDEFLEHEAWIPFGACLCGRAAETGEVLVSDSCFSDCRHDHRFEDMTEHGHYIIPLNGQRGLVGVIFLYTDIEPDWGNSMKRLMSSLGTMIGNALERVWIEERNKSLLQTLSLALVANNTALIRIDFDAGKIDPIGGFTDTPDLKIRSIAARMRCIPKEYHEDLAKARLASEEITVPFDLISGRRWLTITYMHETIEHGRRVQYNLTRDVTDQMALQDDRARLIVELKDISIKRNRLFGMVAHELRTPVAAITMMASEGDSQEWQSSRANILRSCNDLLHTIDDMRMLVNPDLKRPVRPEAFTIQEMNASVSSSVASIVASSGVQYQQLSAIPLGLQEEEFTADTYRVRVVITNIVKNACLHSNGTHVWMLSRMYLDGEGNEYIEWAVADNGKGIPSHQVDRLFEAGERGDTHAEGTGFGLYIAKNWIEEINGAIEYHPRIQGGSEFWVRVPLVSAIPVALSGEKVVTEAESELEILLSKLNVLLVEDEAMLRMLGEKLLSRLVGQVRVAENGKVGLETFDSRCNLVLTDYFMPEMSGVQMARQLREQGYEGLILGITAATIGEQREELIEAGVDMVLPKPLNAEMFKNAMAQLMAEGRTQYICNAEAVE